MSFFPTKNIEDRIGEVQASPTPNTILARLKDLLGLSGAGVYVRQDSTGTIAKETGGNLADLKTYVNDSTATGTISALNGTVQIAFAGHHSAAVVVSGTWTGTFVIESSCDGGTTWSQNWFSTVNLSQNALGIPTPSKTFTANGIYKVFQTAGITHYRLRMSTAMTGTANVVWSVIAAQPSFIYTQSSIIQSVVVDAANSSTANLAAGATFTGTAANTLGVNAIQISLKTDQNCMVYVDQSPDGTNWDLSDPFNYYYSIDNFGVTVQAISSYFRVRVTNTGASITTYLRLQTALCPIANSEPRSADADGNFKVGVKSTTDGYGWGVENTPMGEMRTVTPCRLAGATFNGTTIDPNFWTATVANSATITQANAEITLTSGTNAAGSAQLNSVRAGRYVSGNSLRARFQIQLGDTGTANNTRQWGIAWGATMPTITDGAYFELAGTTLGVVTLKGGVATRVASGSFNGKLGAVYSMGTSVASVEIYWTNGKVYFVVGDILLHTVSASSATWADTMTHHLYMSNINSGNTTSVTLKCRVASIHRLGPLETDPIYKRLTGAATTVLKYSAGKLHRVVLNSTGGTNVTLYDNTAASGNVIALLVTGGIASIEYGTPFYNGLTAVTSGAGCDMTIVYE